MSIISSSRDLLPVKRRIFSHVRRDASSSLTQTVALDAPHAEGQHFFTKFLRFSQTHGFQVMAYFCFLPVRKASQPGLGLGAEVA
jgi:hypothetical protein